MRPPESLGRAPLCSAGIGDLGRSHRFQEGQELRWRAGDLGKFCAVSPGVRADQKVNVSELSLPEFWGNQLREAAGKGPRHTCTETAACCSPRKRGQESGRKPVPPSPLLPSPLYSPPLAIFFSHTLHHLPVSSFF